MVVGNPANTNALIASTCAPSIPKENFSALTRLDQNRATSQIAMKSGVTANKVEVSSIFVYLWLRFFQKVTIWGNHSATQYPDAWQATVEKDGKSVSASTAVNDDAWLKGDFITTVQVIKFL